MSILNKSNRIAKAFTGTTRPAGSEALAKCETMQKSSLEDEQIDILKYGVKGRSGRKKGSLGRKTSIASMKIKHASIYNAARAEGISHDTALKRANAGLVRAHGTESAERFHGSKTGQKHIARISKEKAPKAVTPKAPKPAKEKKTYNAQEHMQTLLSRGHSFESARAKVRATVDRRNAKETASKPSKETKPRKQRTGTKLPGLEHTSARQSAGRGRPRTKTPVWLERKEAKE